jgi:hypothetical protein
MKIKSNHNNLLNYFLYDEKYLSKIYVKKSKRFLHSVSNKVNKRIKNANTNS